MTTTTNRIDLHVDGDSWMAAYSGPHADEVRRLFGTTTLPSSFRATATGSRVLARIRELNPGVIVTVS